MSEISDTGYELIFVSIALAYDSRLVGAERVFKMIDKPTMLPRFYSKLINAE